MAILSDFYRDPIGFVGSVVLATLVGLVCLYMLDDCEPERSPAPAYTLPN